MGQGKVRVRVMVRVRVRARVGRVLFDRCRRTLIGALARRAIVVVHA